MLLDFGIATADESSLAQSGTQTLIIDILSQYKISFHPVCSFGRSGSTLLMGLLSEANVHVNGGPPFEDRTLQVAFLYLLRSAFQVESQNSSKSEKWNETFFGITYQSQLLGSPEKSDDVKSKIKELANSYFGARKSGWAEKCIGLDVFKMLRSYDAGSAVRPIFLLRDPRDIFVSVKQFNERRGFSGFNDNGNDAGLYASICGFQKTLVIESQRSNGTLIYYEDVIVKREQTIIQLLQHVRNSDLSQNNIRRLMDRMDLRDSFTENHMTSPDAASSASRWRDSSNRGLWPVFETQRSILSELGYGW